MAEREVTRAEFETLRTEVSDLKTSDAVRQVHNTNVETRLTSIEGSLSWLVRLALGALLLALIQYITGGGLTLG